MGHDGQHRAPGVAGHEERDLVEVLGHQVVSPGREVPVEVAGGGEVEGVGVAGAVDLQRADAVASARPRGTSRSGACTSWPRSAIRVEDLLDDDLGSPGLGVLHVAIGDTRQMR